MHGAPPGRCGGQCERTAILEVCGLSFCEVHGAEALASTLEELYFDATNFLGRLDNSFVSLPNPAALLALREAVPGLQGAEASASGREANRALRRAYPMIPERVAEDTLGFDYQDPERGDTPVDWNYASRMLIHKLMRLVHEAGSDHYLVGRCSKTSENASRRSWRSR